MTFPTFAGWNYAVEYRSLLSSGPWSLLPTSPIPSVRATTVLTDTNAARGDSRFYRVTRNDKTKAPA
jgi:hypothetical protein